VADPRARLVVADNGAAGDYLAILPGFSVISSSFSQALDELSTRSSPGITMTVMGSSDDLGAA
jgi:hypothetical protein